MSIVTNRSGRQTGTSRYWVKLAFLPVLARDRTGAGVEAARPVPVAAYSMVYSMVFPGVGKSPPLPHGAPAAPPAQTRPLPCAMQQVWGRECLCALQQRHRLGAASAYRPGLRAAPMRSPLAGPGAGPSPPSTGGAGRGPLPRATRGGRRKGGSWKVGSLRQMKI